jgi:CO/xanthine dehydrogenase Mo-binding subunit
MSSLVNRFTALASLTEQAEVLASGRGGTVVLRGAAGQGSSTVLRQWVADRAASRPEARVTRAGDTAIVGGCVSSS